MRVKKNKQISIMIVICMLLNMFLFMMEDINIVAITEIKNVMLATNNSEINISAWHNDGVPTPVQERNDDYALFSNINDGNKSSNSYLELTDMASGTNESRYIEIDLGVRQFGVKYLVGENPT